MTNRYMQLAFTPGVKAEQDAHGSRNAYSRADDASNDPDILTDPEIEFIGRRDSFYMATVSETGWPYLQHRGGPSGFVKVLGPRTLGIGDYRGNRQYVSLGNVRTNNRASLFFMDYANKRRLKVLVTVTHADLNEDSDLAARLWDRNYKAKLEHGLLFEIEAFDWNCPQHITPRFSEAEIGPGIRELHARIAELEAELADKHGDAG